MRTTFSTPPPPQASAPHRVDPGSAPWSGQTALQALLKTGLACLLYLIVSLACARRQRRR